MLTAQKLSLDDIPARKICHKFEIKPSKEYKRIVQMFDTDSKYDKLMKNCLYDNMRILGLLGYKEIEKRSTPINCGTCGYKKTFEYKFSQFFDSIKSIDNICMCERVYKHKIKDQYISIWYTFGKVQEDKSDYIPVHVFSWNEKQKDYYNCNILEKE